MVLLGNDIKISTTGYIKEYLAASKSCTIDMSCEEIEVASPSTGDWKEIIAGRKSWQVSLDWLVPCRQYEMLTISSNAFIAGGQGYAIVNGTTYRPEYQNGFVFLAFDRYGDANLAYSFEYNLANPNHTLVDKFTSFVTNYSTDGYAHVIYIASAYAVDSTDHGIWAAIKSAYGVSFTSPAAGSKMSFTLFVQTFDGESRKTLKTSSEGVAITRMAVDDWGDFTSPLDGADIGDRLLTIGTQYNLDIVLDKPEFFAGTALTGKAFCTRAECTANKGSILKGSFKFVGNGPLAPPTTT